MGAETGRMHGDGVQERRAGEAGRDVVRAGGWLVVGGRAGQGRQGRLDPGMGSGCLSAVRCGGDAALGLWVVMLDVGSVRQE